MSFSRWQKLMARITRNTVVSADTGVATPTRASGASIFSFLIGLRDDTTSMDAAKPTSWRLFISQAQRRLGIEASHT
jgi:hypothetical protein